MRDRVIRRSKIINQRKTAIVYAMPREAIERGGAEIVLPSYKIADAIIKEVRKNKL